MSISVVSGAKYIAVDIATEDLLLRSMKMDDWSQFHELRNHPTVQKYYGQNTELIEEQTAKQVAVLACRWLNGNVFSGFAVVGKTDPESLIGVVILDPNGPAGEAVVGGFGDPEHCRKGYSEQVVRAIHQFALWTIQKGYTLGGSPLHTLHAKVDARHPYSIGLVEKLGFTLSGRDSDTHLYTLKLGE